MATAAAVVELCAGLRRVSSLVALLSLAFVWRAAALSDASHQQRSRDRRRRRTANTRSQRLPTHELGTIEHRAQHHAIRSAAHTHSSTHGAVAARRRVLARSLAFSD